MTAVKREMRGFGSCFNCYRSCWPLIFIQFDFYSIYSLFIFLTNCQMEELKAELKALRECHEITAMELGDIKEDNNRLRKINTTLVETLSKQQADPIRQIKLIIEGDHYRLRILQLQSQIEKLTTKMDDQIEKKANQLIQQVRSNQKNTFQQQCQQCKRGCSQCKKLQQIIDEKNDTIDQLRLDLEEVKADLEIIVAKNKNSTPESNQLKKNNQALLQRLKQMEKYMIDVDQHHEEMNKLEDQWAHRYDQLNEQHQLALQKLEGFFRSKQNAGSRTSIISPSWKKNSNNKENQMKKKIQHLAGELASRKNSISPIKGYNPKPTAQSRLLTDSDYSLFSIKDGINRAQQGQYFG